jgi:uncharacterized membrane protein YfhO
VTLTAEEGGIYYAILTAGGTGKVTYIGGGTEEETFSDLKNGSILYLGYLEMGQSITLTNGDDGDETPKIQADIYRMDEEVLSEALSVLSKQHLENVEWESDSLSGDLSLESPGRLILSIPYEDGWSVTINGEEVQGESFGGCLMAFDLEAGDYRIEMYYVPKGLYAGVLISIVSILLFAVLQFFSQKPVDRIP